MRNGRSGMIDPSHTHTDLFRDCNNYDIVSDEGQLDVYVEQTVL